jgi:hypothetical protein
MQTTVDIPDELYRQAEGKAAREGIPVGDIIAQGLRLALAEPRMSGHRRIAFPLHRSAEPGVLGVEAVRAAEESVAKEEDFSRGGAV